MWRVQKLEGGGRELKIGKGFICGKEKEAEGQSGNHQKIQTSKMTYFMHDTNSQ